MFVSGHNKCTKEASTHSNNSSRIDNTISIHWNDVTNIYR